MAQAEAIIARNYAQRNSDWKPTFNKIHKFCQMTFLEDDI